MTQTINFNGITGQVLESSPHGNYLVIALSDQVSICGTFSNKWNWEETNDSQFKAFVTYIGCPDYIIAGFIIEWAKEQGVDFDIAKGEDEPRASKRIRDRQKYPLELKIRGLTAQLVCEFVKG